MNHALQVLHILVEKNNASNLCVIDCRLLHVKWFKQSIIKDNVLLALFKNTVEDRVFQLISCNWIPDTISAANTISDVSISASKMYSCSCSSINTNFSAY